VKRAKPVTSFTIGLVLVLYFIHTISKISQDVSFLGYLSPFHYVGVDVLTSTYRLDPWNMTYFLGLTLALVIFSWRNYRRKDIYI
jgi:EamA domain-containing membrane protein RarD